MCNFIKDYLDNPSSAISAASESARKNNWYDTIDESVILAQISSPEFRLYEEIILS